MANCCQTCAYRIVESDPDETSYYCNFDGKHIPDLPLQTRIDLGIAALKSLPKGDEFLKLEKKRDKWLVSHAVRAGNVCDNFKLKGKK